MAAFQGFPSRPTRQTPIPNLFFTAVLPLIDDLAELKVTLHLFWKLSWKKGYPRFVTFKELAGDLDLMSGLATGGVDAAKELRRGLTLVTARGAFLHLALEQDNGTDDLYFLNSDVDRVAVQRVRRGELDLGAMPKPEAVTATPEHRTVFDLYEEHIGLVTPLMADELREAEETYPAGWIVDAFREAARLNKHNWRYIQRILERWKAEGRPSGRPERGPEAVPGGGKAPTSRGGYLVKREPD